MGTVRELAEVWPSVDHKIAVAAETVVLRVDLQLVISTKVP